MPTALRGHAMHNMPTQSRGHGTRRARALAELAKAHAKRGDRNSANRLFEKALENAKEVQQDKEELASNLRNAALASVARARAEAGQERTALAWVAQQTDPA